MIFLRIPLLALAVFALAVPAQQPSPAHASATPQKNASPPAGQPQAPQGNLVVRIMSDDGSPVPGAAIEVDGMRMGGAPAGAGTGRSSTLPSGTRIIGADPNPDQTSPSPSNPNESNPGESNPNETSLDQSGLFRPQKRPCPTPPPASSRPAKTQTGNTQPQSGNAQPGQGPSNSPRSGAQAAHQPGQPPLPPDCGLTNMVQAGTAESISELGGTSAGAAPALPPGAVPLQTDAQGQLTLQLPPGEHTLSVSVYGFDPWTGHFTLSGKHRQIVEIKLSTAATSVILPVGPDSRTQTESAIIDALIPLEPVQTLETLPARTRKRLL